jgi:diguanylate cyclase (GGDEF)-like protein
MQFATSPYTFPFIIAILLNALTVGLVWFRRDFPGRKWLILALLSFMVWNLGAGLEVSSIDLTDKIIWAKVEYLGANTASQLLLLFFLTYPSQKIRLSPLRISLLFVLPAISLLAIMTNEWHLLYWTGFTPVPGSDHIYLWHHGPFYWIALAYNYLCGTLIGVLIIRGFLQLHGLYRLQFAALLASSLLPFAAGLIYSFELNPFPGLDILPLAFSLAGTGISLSVVFLRMFNLVPIGRNLLVEKLQDGLIVINQRHEIVDINPAAQRLLTPAPLKLGDSIDKAGDVISAHFLNLPCKAEIDLDGATPRTVELKTTPLLDELERPVGTMGIIRDITDITQMKQKLHDMAMHDELTGLPNRTLFLDRFNLASANVQRSNKKMAIFSLDIDRFKNINDSLGHPTGDRILVEVGRRLTEALRPTDTVARFGGDEFVVLLWEINRREDTEIVAGKIMEKIKPPFLIDDQKITLSVSIGIAVYPDDGSDILELIRKSDVSLYCVKTHGRDSYQLYDERYRLEVELNQV